MMQYFAAFGAQNARLRRESGTVSAISGILKAPMDIIADKLRGYLGLCRTCTNAATKCWRPAKRSCRICATWP